jgi:hypothetical protein
MAPSNLGDNRIPASDAAANEPAKSSPVRYDLGGLLKEQPFLYRIGELRIAKMGYLRLELQASVVFFTEDHFFQFVAIDCVKVVDYSIRPANPATLLGGPYIKYCEKHELLDNVSQTVPNTDGMKVFNPPVKFTLLGIDQSYIIAQRFEMTILTDGVTTTIGWIPIQKQQKMEALKRALDSIGKYRLPPLQKS